MKLWQRYFIGESLKLLLFILAVLFVLFTVIDYSLNTKHLVGHGVPWGKLLGYYGAQFFTYMQLLVPLALMLSVIKTVTTANTHNELVALRAGGLAARKLLQPLLLVAALCASFLWANYQWIYPTATAKVERFEDRYLRGTRKDDKPKLNVVRLHDGSKLLYQSYDTSREAFFDVYWLRTGGDLYRMHHLMPHGKTPEATFVDHIIRSEEGHFLRDASFKHVELPDMRFGERDLIDALVPPKDMSLTDLWRRLPTGHASISDYESQVVSAFNLKLAYPLLCFLVVLAPAPWCIRFRRHLPIFFIFCLSIAGFLAFLTTMDAMAILGESRTLPPGWALWLPVLSCFGIFGYRYARL
jgi:lipopolysaccharide export system permease protein